MGRSKYQRSDERLTPCLCPKCGKEFKSRRHYTGKLPARYFCMVCEPAASYAHRSPYDPDTVISTGNIIKGRGELT